MPSFDPTDDQVTYLVVSACKGALRTAERCTEIIQQGNQVNVIATPTAASWIDSEQIERITGWPVRHQMRTPDQPTFTPLGNKVLATPVSLNTLTKWASGHTDNLAVGLLCEALGANVPIEAEIQVSQEFANHPAVIPALQILMNSNVRVRSCPGGFDLTHLFQDIP